MQRGIWVVLGLLAACGEPTSNEVQFGEKASPVAQSVYRAVMDNYRIYPGLNEPKILSGCLSLVEDREPPLRIHQIFAWYTDVSSDAPVFAGELRRNAMQACRDWQRTEDVACTCQMIDINGKNVLKL